MIIFGLSNDRFQSKQSCDIAQLAYFFTIFSRQSGRFFARTTNAVKNDDPEFLRVVCRKFHIVEFDFSIRFQVFSMWRTQIKVGGYGPVLLSYFSHIRKC